MRGGSSTRELPACIADHWQGARADNARWELNARAPSVQTKARMQTMRKIKYAPRAELVVSAYYDYYGQGQLPHRDWFTQCPQCPRWPPAVPDGGAAAAAVGAQRASSQRARRPTKARMQTKVRMQTLHATDLAA
jgi:hypothetical protein